MINSSNPDVNVVTSAAPINPASVSKAIDLGKAAIDQGMTKVQAARTMFPLLTDEPREVVWQAFQEGAGLTPKGAVTYHYNMIREAKKGKQI